ncbi:MAG: DUF2334 domain-containing protein [Arenicellales bacterium]|jgi:predicted deacetylase
MARYLLRFDDVCPTMNWRVWERIEPTLVENGIKPILAVVPDNQDPKLMVDAPRADFWARVRAWQAAGWCIALHGYQHRYVTREPGLIGLNTFSEFAGLPETEQRDKLVRALAIFSDNGVRADAWIAPAHSFDLVTLRLLLELGIDTISDGVYFRPVRHHGALWIPQQLWDFKAMPAGLWTVCIHCNAWDEADIARLRTWTRAHSAAMSSVEQVPHLYRVRPPGWLDRGFAALFPAAREVRRRVLRR